MATLYTFGDSILDCGAYNGRGVHPGGLLLRNDDALFPEFRGRDVRSRAPDARLDHRAVDGATSDGLLAQARGVGRWDDGAALLTVGGNDLLRALAAGRAPDAARLRANLRAFLDAMPVRPVLVGTVYDPTLGDDARSFLPVDPAFGRAGLAAVNAVLAEAARDAGMLADVHAHFLGGDASWFASVIEPSLRGASEVRRCFLPGVLRAMG